MGCHTWRHRWFLVTCHVDLKMCWLVSVSKHFVNVQSFFSLSKTFSICPKSFSTCPNVRSSSEVVLWVWFSQVVFILCQFFVRSCNLCQVCVRLFKFYVKFLSGCTLPPFSSVTMCRLGCDTAPLVYFVLVREGLKLLQTFNYFPPAWGVIFDHICVTWCNVVILIVRYYLPFYLCVRV